MMKKSDMINHLRSLQEFIRLDSARTPMKDYQRMVRNLQYESLDTAIYILEAIKGESMKEIAQKISDLNDERHAARL